MFKFHHLYLKIRQVSDNIMAKLVASIVNLKKICNK